MSRHARIASATFDAADLPLPVSARIVRSSQPLAAGSDADTFATSVQLARPQVAVEIRLRGTDAAEGLALGASGDLCITIAPAQSDQSPRAITVSGAVLHDVELLYEPSQMACAVLRFAAEASDGAEDPVSAEDAP